MENWQFPFMESSADYHYPHQSSEARVASPSSASEHEMLHLLMDTGFYWEEAVQLLHLREHLYENSEMQQRISEDLRMHFVRWLYEQGEINEM
jgi:hypothetical protein